MLRNRRLIYILVCLLLLVSCENTTFRSSVPAYPVRISIDTRVGPFVGFVPESTYDYITIDKKGYHYHDYTQALTVTDMIGYAGVVVFIDGNSEYKAFDLCCPKCLNPSNPCELDGLYAVCPLCEEKYDLSWGYAFPTQGIAKESLRKYSVLNSSGKLTITQ